MSLPQRDTQCSRKVEFQFSLRSLFLAVVVCAVLIVAYRSLGPIVIAVPLALVIALATALWMFDAVMMASDSLHRAWNERTEIRDAPSADDHPLAGDDVLEDLRGVELAAVERFAHAMGTLEDVLRARGVRLKAEIDHLRATSASRRPSAVDPFRERPHRDERTYARKPR